MKKTLIALAVAASAVSGMAHAWTNGDFNGSVDIGGSIIADDYRQKWSWAVGSDINGFSNVLRDLTEGGTKLTITVSGNKPILLGKTTEAFAAPVAGGVGAIPQIAFTDFQGNAIQVNGIEQSNAGLGFLPVPMKNAAGSAIGTAKVNITFAGIAGLVEIILQLLKLVYVLFMPPLIFRIFLLVVCLPLQRRGQKFHLEQQLLMLLLCLVACQRQMCWLKFRL